MNIKAKLWVYEHSLRLWRSSAYSRGFKAGLKYRPGHDAQHQAWVNFLQRYYYEHQNHHLKGDL